MAIKPSELEIINSKKLLDDLVEKIEKEIDKYITFNKIPILGDSLTVNCDITIPINLNELKALERDFLDSNNQGAYYLLNSLNNLYKQSGWKELKLRKSYDLTRGFRIEHIELIK